MRIYEDLNSLPKDYQNKKYQSRKYSDKIKICKDRNEPPYNGNHNSTHRKGINRKVIFLKRMIALSFVISTIFLYLDYHVTKQIHFSHTINLITLSIVISVLLVNHLRVRKKKRLLNSDIFDVDLLSGVDFELFLYYHLKRMGYKVRLTPVTHDFGADLILKHKKEKTIIQAKRWNESVGIKAVQEIVGAINYYDADYAIVITNSIFTKSAKILANANEVQLIGRKELIQMMETGEIGNTLEDDRIEEEFCPFCGYSLVLRNGYYGEFFGCSGYPMCKFTKQC